MALYGENQAIVRCAVVWDGCNKPETNDSGRLVHSLKCVLLDQAHRGEIEQLANKELQTGDFRGQFPAGGIWPVKDVPPGEFGGEFEGRAFGVINPKTYNGEPEVWENGNVLQKMIWSGKIYPGCIVDVLVHCYSFNSKSKGITLALDAVQIIDSTAPKLAIASGGGSGAFGGGAGAPQGQQAQQGGYQPPQGQQGGYQPPQGQQGGYQPPQGQPPQGGYQPPQGQPPQGQQAQQGGYQPPQGQQAQQGGYPPPQGQQAPQSGYQPPQGQQAQQGGYQPPQGQQAQQGGYQPDQGFHNGGYTPPQNQQ